MRTPIAFLASLFLVACTPSDDHDAVVFLRDSEPNDAREQAQLLGEPGVYVFQGACSGADLEDWYSGNSGGGTVEVSLRVDTEPPVVSEDWEPEDSDVPPIASIALKSASLATLGEDNDVTPAAPAQFQGAADLGTIYLQVSCPDRTLWYSGVIVVR